MAKKSSGKGLGLDAPATCAPVYRQSAADKERERRYRAEDDLRTLQRAEEVRADRSRVTEAKKVAAEQVRALSRITKGKG